MYSFFGKNLKLTIFGASHAPQIGMTLEGIPEGNPVDLQQLQAFMDRRAPGQSPWSTPRKEADSPHFTEGVENGRCNGGSITAVIYNENARSSDYASIQHTPRPGHADLTAWMKYGPEFDMAGGGPFSGRMTAPLCIAGGMCKQWLQALGIQIHAQILQVGDLHRDTCPNFEEAMVQKILAIKEQGDSIGGRIGCTVTGLPCGMGGPLFDGVDGHLASILYAIPGVKAVGFGASDEYPYLTGSQANDPIIIENNRITTATNHCGGILGGITNGMPLTFDVTIKPTPSIALPQKTVNLQTMEEVTIQVQGRHDPCIVPRAVPVVEAAAAIALFDLLLGGN